MHNKDVLEKLQNKTYRKEFLHDARMEFLDEALERNQHLESTFIDQATEKIRTAFNDWVEKSTPKKKHVKVQSTKKPEFNIFDFNFEDLKTNFENLQT